MGIDFRHGFHHGISGDLCHNAGGTDGNTLSVPFDDAFLRCGYLGNGYCVRKDKVRLYFQFGKGFPHGFISCLQNIDFVNTFVGNHTHSPSHCLFSDDFAKLLPFLGREFFGVIDTSNLAVFGQNHRRRYHRAGKGASAHFVNACHQFKTLFVALPFVSQQCFQSFQLCQISVVFFLKTGHKALYPFAAVGGKFRQNFRQFFHGTAVQYFFDFPNGLHGSSLLLKKSPRLETNRGSCV